MFLIPLASLLLCPGLSTERNITFALPAMTLERLLPKLGEAAGIKMEADKSIKNEVVLVQVKEVPVKDLMSRIAKAACGEWEEQDGKQVLKLNRDQDRAERVTDRQKKLSDLQSQMNDVAEQIGLGGSKRKDYFSPGDQEVLKILRLVPLEVIAKLGQMESAVFAYPASGSQYPLGPACIPLAQEILNQTQNRQPGELAKVILMVSKYSQIEVRARLIRNDGIVMAESSLRLYSRIKPQKTMAISLSHPELKIAVPNARKAMVGKIGLFALRGQFIGWCATSCEDYETVTFADSLLRPVGYSRLTEEHDNLLRRPDETEPLSIGLGDAVSSFAETQEMNLVACLPDSAENQACLDLREQNPTATEMTQKAITWGLDIHVEGNWCMVRPISPSEARDQRLDRKVLRSLVNQAGYQKLPPLELLASYCASQPLLDPAQSFEMTWLRMNCSETAKAIYNTVPNRCILRFWGLLSPVQRAALGSNGSVNYALLPTEAKAMLAKAMPRMYRKIDPLIPDQTNKPREMPVFNVINDYSEIVPFPNAMQAEVAGSSSSRDTLLGISEDGERSVLDFTKVSLINMSLPRDPLNPDLFMIESDRVVFPYYQPGRRTAIKLQVRVLNKPERIRTLTFIYNLCDDQIPEGASLIKRNDLPQPYLKWLSRQLMSLQQLEERLSSINRQENKP